MNDKEIKNHPPGDESNSNLSHVSGTVLSKFPIDPACPTGSSSSCPIYYIRECINRDGEIGGANMFRDYKRFQKDKEGEE